MGAAAQRSRRIHSGVAFSGTWKVLKLGEQTGMLGRVELHQKHGLAVFVAISWAGMRTKKWDRSVPMISVQQHKLVGKTHQSIRGQERILLASVVESPGI